MKELNAISYGYTCRMADAEYGHLISLRLGGDPNDPRNPWVEPPDPGHRMGGGVNKQPWTRLKPVGCGAAMHGALARALEGTVRRFVASGQAGVMFSACGPFWPWVMSKVTAWPSWSSRKPLALMLE